MMNEEYKVLPRADTCRVSTVSVNVELVQTAAVNAVALADHDSRESVIYPETGYLLWPDGTLMQWPDGQNIIY